MKHLTLLLTVLCASGCQFVSVEDYKVCGVTVDCTPRAEDASVEFPDAGDFDAGTDAGCVPEVLDPVDVQGRDSNCDGLDGVKSRLLFVDGVRGNDTLATPGDPTKPFATLGAAFAVAAAADAGTFDAVLVTAIAYAEPGLTWTADVDVWGGRSSDGRFSALGPTARSSLLSAAPVGLHIRDVQGRALRNFIVRATGTPAPTQASIGVFVERASPLLLNDELYASAGGAGAAGGARPALPDAGPGIAGGAGVGAQTVPNDAGGLGVCGGDPGFAGGEASVSSASGHAGYGPGGGQPGENFDLDCTPPLPAQATAGADGAMGTSGAPGLEGTGFGTLGPGQLWLGADGQPGGDGTTGLPGSGGGAGGFVKGAMEPSSGGAGGSGGCPGVGGGAGHAGGPSFALVVIEGRAVVGADTFLISANGGAPGEGAPGSVGFPGGAGGPAGPPLISGAMTGCGAFGGGAPGGRGGAGGAGGPGGGGRGGHSIAAYCGADGGLDVMDGGTLSTGLSGTAPDGGRAGVVAQRWNCP